MWKKYVKVKILLFWNKLILTFIYIQCFSLNKMVSSKCVSLFLLLVPLRTHPGKWLGWLLLGWLWWRFREGVFCLGGMLLVVLIIQRLHLDSLVLVKRILIIVLDAEWSREFFGKGRSVVVKLGLFLDECIAGSVESVVVLNWLMVGLGTH